MTTSLQYDNFSTFIHSYFPPSSTEHTTIIPLVPITFFHAAFLHIPKFHTAISQQIVLSYQVQLHTPGPPSIILSYFSSCMHELLFKLICCTYSSCRHLLLCTLYLHIRVVSYVHLLHYHTLILPLG